MLDEVTRGDVGIAVVFHHAREEDVGPAAAVKGRELVSLVESARELDSAVASEIIENDRVAVGDRPDRPPAIDDDKGGKIWSPMPGAASRARRTASSAELACGPSP